MIATGDYLVVVIDATAVTSYWCSADDDPTDWASWVRLDREDV